MDHSIAYYAGVACGIIAVAVLGALLAKKAKKNGRPAPGEYDERQQLARSKAFKYAYFTLIAYQVVNALLEDLFSIVWCEASASLFVGVCLSLAVFVCICIWNEAYLDLSENPRHVLAFLVIATGINLLMGLFRFADGDLINAAGQLTNHSINLTCGLMCLIALINFLLWHRRQATETE